jgi:SAM-dependent methyltransferase
MEHYNAHFSSKNLNYASGDSWIGGKFVVRNISTGYHKIMIDYIDKYIDTNTELKVLLVSENNTVKQDFNNVYPKWDIDTIDLYPEISKDNNCDILGDICSYMNPIPIDNNYDLIINQATLEHLYNPFRAMENLTSKLKNDGLLVSHTHPPGFQYHQFPRDYFRFMKDWWYDLPKYISNIELKELYMHQNRHVFTLYQKI